jgi:hypothetical protein
VKCWGCVVQAKRNIHVCSMLGEGAKVRVVSNFFRFISSLGDN